MRCLELLGFEDSQKEAGTGFQCDVSLHWGWVTVAMVADPLGASDRHFPEGMADFISEGKEMFLRTNKEKLHQLQRK